MKKIQKSTKSLIIATALIGSFPTGANAAGVVLTDGILATSLSASGVYLTDVPVNAFDGDLATNWNAGGYPLQWLEMDLGQNYYVGEANLVLGQFPSGTTTQQIWVSGVPIGTDTSQATLAYTFSGSTGDFQVLSSTFASVLGRYVQIRTTVSPSWVSWREVEIISGDPVPEPSGVSLLLIGSVGLLMKRKRG